MWILKWLTKKYSKEKLVDYLLIQCRVYIHIKSKKHVWKNIVKSNLELRHNLKGLSERGDGNWVWC